MNMTQNKKTPVAMNFIIHYTAYSESGTVLQSGTVIVRNKSSKEQAISKYKTVLKMQYNDLQTLKVYMCYEDNALSCMESCVNNEAYPKVY
jgi:hypothetical protein